MRKLKLQVQISVDGFIAEPNGEMDWMIWDWDDELKDYVAEITEPVDCIVLGRKLAEGFIPHWAKVAANPNDPEYIPGTSMAARAKLFLAKHSTNQNGKILNWPKEILSRKSLN